MSNVLSLSEPTVDTLIPTWTGLEIWHASSQAGVYTLLIQIPYVLHQTTYSYTDTPGVFTDWYKARRYGPGATYDVYSAAWSVAGTRRTLQNIRRLLAQSLHSLTTATTTTAGNAAGTSVVATKLANSVSANRYKHAWVMPVDGGMTGMIRRVRAEDALNLTTGELMVVPAFSAQVATGVGIEIHRLLPPDDDDGWTGLRTCINDALRECWVPDRLAITGVNGQAGYSLSAYEEWLDADAVLEFRRAALDSTLNPFPAGQFETVRDADSLTLQIAPTLDTGNASTLEVFRPTDTLIKVGGVWSTSTAGLVNETDECLLNPDLVVTVALAHAYASLASGPDGGRYDDMARKQRFKANIAKEMHLDHTQRAMSSRLTTANYGWNGKEQPMGPPWGW